MKISKAKPAADPAHTDIKAPESSIVLSPTPDTKAVASSSSTAGEDGIIKGKLSVLTQESRTNEIIKPKTCAEYVSAFKLCAAKTARSTLEMCRIVHEARETLGNDGFEQFCQQIGMNPSQATVVKFCCIGRLYSRFIKHEDRLPANWTSIYLLTQLPAEYFDKVIENNQSLAELTGGQINSLVKQTLDLDVVQTKLPKDGKEKRPVIGKLVFTKGKIDDIDYAAMKRAMQEIEARLPVKFVTVKAADELFEKRKLVKYEREKQKLVRSVFSPDLREFGLSPTLVAPSPAVPAGENAESELTAVEATPGE